MREHSVALFDPGDKRCNTIAFPEMQVVVPLEEDFDCDPLQDDEVRLCSLDGSYERVIQAGDPESVLAEDDCLIYYHFEHVPPGFYNISARIGELWTDISTELLVTPRGAYFMKSKLTADPPAVNLQGRPYRPWSGPAPLPCRLNPRTAERTGSPAE